MFTKKPKILNRLFSIAPKFWILYLVTFLEIERNVYRTIFLQKSFYTKPQNFCSFIRSLWREEFSACLWDLINFDASLIQEHDDSNFRYQPSSFITVTVWWAFNEVLETCESIYILNELCEMWNSFFYKFPVHDALSLIYCTIQVTFLINLTKFKSQLKR